MDFKKVNTESRFIIFLLQWCMSEIKLLHKKKKQNINNLQTSYFILNFRENMKCIKARIYVILDVQQPIERKEFKTHFSTVYLTHTQNQILEKARKYNF